MSQPPDAFARILDSWRPAPETVTDDLGTFPARALAALLGSPDPGDDFALPPLWSEVYLRRPRRVDELGADGHPANDQLVPPLEQRRRMFGGGHVEIRVPLRLGERATRRSSISDVRLREGRSGWLLLVTEQHEYAVAGEVRVRETRDIVYRRPQDITRTRADGAAASSVGATGPSAYCLEPDERLLFCFSALTYNPHRIHYDHRYVVEVEGHRDLLVHGPLSAMGAVEAARRSTGASPRKMDYRLLFPAYCGSVVDFHVSADETGGCRVVGVQDGNRILEARLT